MKETRDIQKKQPNLQGEPIKVDHHSANRHRKQIEKNIMLADKVSSLMDQIEKVEGQIENSENSKARVKGDAERERNAKREELDKNRPLNVGDIVRALEFGEDGIVLRINKLTVSLYYLNAHKKVYLDNVNKVDRVYIKLLEKNTYKDYKSYFKNLKDKYNFIPEQERIKTVIRYFDKKNNTKTIIKKKEETKIKKETSKETKKSLNLYDQITYDHFKELIDKLNKDKFYKSQEYEVKSYLTSNSDGNKYVLVNIQFVKNGKKRIYEYRLYKSPINNIIDYFKETIDYTTKDIKINYREHKQYFKETIEELYNIIKDINNNISRKDTPVKQVKDIKTKEDTKEVKKAVSTTSKTKKIQRSKEIIKQVLLFPDELLEKELKKFDKEELQQLLFDINEVA